MKTSAFALLLTFMLQLYGQNPPQQQPAGAPLRALPDNNLGYPVLITIGNSLGSGFYINTETSIYLITATHVLFEPPIPGSTAPRRLLNQQFHLLSYSRDPADRIPNRIAVDANLLAPENIVRHPTTDVTVVRLFSRTIAQPLANPLAGVTVQQLAVQGLLGVAPENITRLDEVLVGNDVILFGYPSSLALRPSPQIDPERPLLRKGIVAGINIAQHSIILDCPAYFGNSGGPVVEVDQLDVFRKRFRIIGVVDQYVPYTDGGQTFLISANSGYSVIIPMDFVLELIH